MVEVTPGTLADVVREGVTPLQLRQSLFMEGGLDPLPSWLFLTLTMKEERVRLLMKLQYKDGQAAVILETKKDQVTRLRNNYGIPSYLRSAGSASKSASYVPRDPEFDVCLREMWDVRQKLGIGPSDRIISALPLVTQAEIRRMARDFMRHVSSSGNLGGLTPLDKLIIR